MSHPNEDVVCEHGKALDVHCCNCHSGFLFDVDSCVCISVSGDLLAYGRQEKDAALSGKDREAYQFWSGWLAALERLPQLATLEADLARVRQERDARIEPLKLDPDPEVAEAVRFDKPAGYVLWDIEAYEAQERIHKQKLADADTASSALIAALRELVADYWAADAQIESTKLERAAKNAAVQKLADLLADHGDAVKGDER